MTDAEHRDDGKEGALGRWARLKSKAKAGEAVPDRPEAGPESAPGPAPGRGGAAPRAGRRAVPVMRPLADPEEGEIDMEAAPPEALALLRQDPDGGAEPAVAEDDEPAELTPEQEEAVRDLPPIDSLDRDSDFTPFFAENVPEFLKRQAYRALWRSNPFFAFRDGLNDYDEDFRLVTLVGKTLAGEAAGEAAEQGGKLAEKAKPKGKPKPKPKGKAKPKTTAKGKDAAMPGQKPKDAPAALSESPKGAAPEAAGTTGADDDVGDAEDDGEYA